MIWHWRPASSLAGNLLPRSKGTLLRTIRQQVKIEDLLTKADSFYIITLKLSCKAMRPSSYNRRRLFIFLSATCRAMKPSSSLTRAFLYYCDKGVTGGRTVRALFLHLDSQYEREDESCERCIVPISYPSNAAVHDQSNVCRRTTASKSHSH